MWSWILAFVELTGLFLIGEYSIVGWLFMALNEVLWWVYGIATHQYGFFAASTGYVVIYIRSWKKWRNLDK